VNLLARQIFASGAEKSGWKPMAQTLFRLAWEKTAAAAAAKPSLMKAHTRKRR
jgi:hypothetical protein